MQVTLDIPDTLAAQLAAAGKEPARAALDVLEDWATREKDAQSFEFDPAEDAEVREAIRQGQEDVAAGRVRPARQVFEEMRRKCAYRVDLNPGAEQDLATLYKSINAQSSPVAAIWFHGLERLVYQ